MSVMNDDVGIKIVQVKGLMTLIPGYRHVQFYRLLQIILIRFMIISSINILDENLIWYLSKIAIIIGKAVHGDGQV